MISGLIGPVTQVPSTIESTRSSRRSARSTPGVLASSKDRSGLLFIEHGDERHAQRDVRPVGVEIGRRKKKSCYEVADQPRLKQAAEYRLLLLLLCRL